MSAASPRGPLEDSVRLFAALGDPTRMAIVARLASGDSRSISALAQDAGLSRQAVTKHLHVLDAAGLVSVTRSGRETRYLLEGHRLAAARRYLAAISAQWDEAIDRLRILVET